MQSGRILVMRHAEKSEDPLDPDLSKAGRERANSLAAYVPATFGKPKFFFATAPSKHSLRPIETLTPLSKACGVELNTSFADQDYGALAHTLLNTPRYDGALIVVCWHHGNIPPLADALKAKEGHYPNPWRKPVFNLILEFDFAHGQPSVRQLTEPF